MTDKYIYYYKQEMCQLQYIILIGLFRWQGEEKSVFFKERVKKVMRTKSVHEKTECEFTLLGFFAHFFVRTTGDEFALLNGRKNIFLQETI